jgi:uncharacterized membrane protein
MHRIPARYAPLLTAFLVSVFMSCIVSGIATLKNTGFEPVFFGKWMAAWGLSWIVAFPVLLLVLPLVRKLVASIVRPPT